MKNTKLLKFPYLFFGALFFAKREITHMQYGIKIICI